MQRALVILLLAVSLSAPESQAATPTQVKEAVEARYQVTTRSAFGRVKEPGTVLLVQKEGIRADKPKALMRPSIIRDGELVTVGGGRVVLGGNTGHSLSVDERVLLYGVKSAKKYVALVIATTETFKTIENGSTVATPFEAAVSFRYEEGLASVSTEQVLRDIAVWFKTEEEAAEAGTKTIALGQTPEEIIDILGPPEKRVELGSKTIFVYEDLKIVFVDGRVSDVE
jgi:hypothetical protein